MFYFSISDVVNFYLSQVMVLPTKLIKVRDVSSNAIILFAFVFPVENKMNVFIVV